MHVFITHFACVPGLDEEPGRVTQEEIDELLERGIDGIMTDRPCEVRALMDDWLRRNRPPQCQPPLRDLSACRAHLAKMRQPGPGDPR